MTRLKTPKPLAAKIIAIANEISDEITSTKATLLNFESLSNRAKCAEVTLLITNAIDIIFKV